MDRQTDTSSEKEPKSVTENVTEMPREVRFTYLLASIIALIVFLPFHDGSPIALVVLAGINSAILIAAAFAAGTSRRTLLIALVLATPGVVLQWLLALTSDPLISDLRYVFLVLFYGFTIYHILGEVLRPGDVTRDKIAGAIAAYMLTAVAWSGLYALADRLVPGSFSIQGQTDATHAMSIFDLIYFSFTTLTTTGYGDITPLSRHAQSLAILEQQTGVFYVAILVARLAGLYRPGSSQSLVDDLRRWRRLRRRKDGT